MTPGSTPGECKMQGSWTWFVALALLQLASSYRFYTLQPARDAVIVFPQWIAITNGALQLRFRTSQQNATLIYTEGVSGYLWLRLDAGSLSVSFQHTSQEPSKETQTMNGSVGTGLHDDRYHLVKLQHKWGLQVEVDHLQLQLHPADEGSVFETTATSRVYVGGVSPTVAPLREDASAMPHLAGCVGDVLFANHSSLEIDLRELDPLQYIGSAPGCVSPCDQSPGVCNGGVCLNDWAENSTSCDCSLLQRGGESCTESELCTAFIHC